MWLKIVIGIAILIVLTVVALVLALRQIFRDRCPCDGCRGTLRFKGDQLRDGRLAAVYECDRCDEEVVFYADRNKPKAA